jgi:hypothetical protein
MGRTEFLGPYNLFRYTPQSDSCDAWMRDNWCVNNINNVECACFEELPGIEAKSAALKVDLPVICFGPTCATQNTYKTQQMLSKPCNLTVCQQTVNTTPGVINEGDDTVFCGGQFFKPTGEIAQPTITIINNDDTVGNTSTPFYVWIMLGVSGLLFLLLIYLLFAPSEKKKPSILREIEKIQKSNAAKAQLKATPVAK